MRKILTILALCLSTIGMQAKDYTLKSPDGHLTVVVTTENGINWQLQYDDQQVLLPSAIGLEWTQGKKTYDDIGRVGKTAVSRHDSRFRSAFYKKDYVSDSYNQLLLYTNRQFTIEVRAYNDGAAYRLLNANKGITVKRELTDFHFAADCPAFIPYVNDLRGGERYSYSFESYYDEQPLSQMYPDSLAITPLAVCLPGGMKAIVMDAGVEDYPGMMLLKGEGNTLKADFAPYPLEQAVLGFGGLNYTPTKRADYIARVEAPRSLPWRAVVVTKRDADILNCDMAQRLAPECRLKDTSWIRPGKVAWDWWNNTNLTGVDFASGMNTRTYMYYIDFAQKNRLEYIIIDEGWSGRESLTQLLNPEIDIPRLVSYGRERGVGVILWSSWRNMVGNNPDATAAEIEPVMKHYADMGVKGFKVDFFDRDDQPVIRSTYQIAEAAARYHLLLDYHGLKPSGIQRAYPNVVNFEGVKGLENSKWEPRNDRGPVHDQPRYDVTIPYLRMLCGPLDYTPGAMVNAVRSQFFGNNDHPMSQGTRAHQVAMYTTFEAPLQMLADSPSKYMKEQPTTDFIAQIPTTFDETVALDGQLGEYTVIARRKGNTWYVAALTNWTPRSFQLPLNFLGSGSHEALIFADGVNATKEATDYALTRQTVDASTLLTVELAPGGGWSAIIQPAAAATATTAFTPKNNVVKPTDRHIQYVGRISFQNPERPAFNYPGTQIIAAFEGTQAKLVCKPGSGYFMAQVDEAEPFKIAFRGKRDSVVTIASALQPGRHVVRLMYCIEGYEMSPEFRGFVFDGPIVDATALPTRNIEFVGNSITCGYGNEDSLPTNHFCYETENHYYGYAQLTARALGAKAHIVARSGIGAYRNYNGPKTGTPDNRMPAQYEYTLYAEKSAYRTRSKAEAEKWDFSRFTPDVVCINLGTNDLSTNNYDTKLLKQGYKNLLQMVRRNNPSAKIVFLTGTMLQGKELDICKRLLNEVADEAHQAGDAHVYRFDMSPQGDLGYGADWHPSLPQHRKMADELSAYLRQLMQWN